METLISAASAIGALVAAFYAFGSKQIAEKALSIAKEEYSSKNVKLKLYLVDGINFTTKNTAYIFAFNISVINPATVSNTIYKLELIINFIRSDSTIGSFILQHNPDLHDAIVGHEVTPFIIPKEVPAKSATTNWCLFSCDNTFSKFGRIDKYIIRVTDTTGAVCEVDSYLIKEYRLA